MGTRISELLLVRVHGDRKDAKDDDGDRVCALRGDAGISMSGAPSRSGISLIVDNDAWRFF